VVIVKKPFLSLAVLLGALLLGAPARAGSSCKEVSDVVGEQQCTTYGKSWSIERSPPITFRFGFRYAEFSTSGATFKEDFKPSRRPEGYEGYSFSGDALGVPKLATMGTEGGFTWFVKGQTYLGLECGFAFASIDSPAIVTGQYTLTNKSGLNVLSFHGGLPVGYRVPLGRASIRGEMLLGGIVTSISQNVSAPNVPGAPDAAAASTFRWLAEPRVAADIWFTQHISFGAYGGVNLVDTRGRVLGLSLTFHNRSFDGDMSLW
jgi:hypothetical protein